MNLTGFEEALDEKDPRYPGFDPRYKNLSKSQLPLTECLYVTLGVFRLMAVRNPAGHGSLIAFTAGRAWRTPPSWAIRECAAW
ncbi:MAG TPA: hypothetical protein VMU77_05870 [Acidimicrobiales bacterium]|nr:hypothetical protein [Acidimicrobiales bacterium]